MTPRLRSLDGTVLAFAHRGARAHAPENTLAAFELAVEMGATGLESDVWLTADGVAVLDHDGVVGPRLRRRPIARVDQADLPNHIPTLSELYGLVGTDRPLSLDVKDPAAFDVVVATARGVGGGAEEHLWLCSDDVDHLTAWRHRTSARLVNSTRLGRIGHSPEQRAALLRERGIDGLNLPHREWNGGLVTLLHRFERYALAWGLIHDRELAAVIDAGIDGVYSDHVDRMMQIVGAFYPDADPDASDRP